MKKSIKVGNGLTFNYKVNGVTKKYGKETIEEFLSIVFPKNNNPLSPYPDTEISNVKWRHEPLELDREVNTVADLQMYLKNEDVLSALNATPVHKKSNKQKANKKVCGSTLVRKGIYDIETVRKAVEPYMFESQRVKRRVMFDGDMVKANSLRFQTFFTKGCTCVRCGITGSFFAKEKKGNDERWHLELYGYDNDGNEVMMTKDHIVPSSLGGKNEVANFQPMCVKCNSSKGNSCCF